jgi:hypothetical protein
MNWKSVLTKVLDSLPLIVVSGMVGFLAANHYFLLEDVRWLAKEVGALKAKAE